MDPTEQNVREDHQRRGEDDRHDATVVHAKRHVVTLPTVDATSSGLLRLLHRNPPLSLRNQNRSCHHKEEGEKHKDDLLQAHIAGLGLLDHIPDRSRHSDHDTRHNQEADSISDTIFVNLLTQPHQEDRTGRQANHTHHEDENRSLELRINQVHVTATPHHVVHEEGSLHQT